MMNKGKERFDSITITIIILRENVSKGNISKMVIKDAQKKNKLF
jgi:hypothetical protein